MSASMKQIFLICTLSFLTAHAWSQDQMAIRLNEKGILKVLQAGLKYNASGNKKTFKVPANLYKFTLKKSELLKNPIVPIINEVSDLNLNRDLNYYLHTSDVLITGAVNPQTLQASIIKSYENGFDFKLSLSFPQIVVTAKEMSLCENKAQSSKKCGSGLKATVQSLRVTSKGRPASLTANFRLVSKNGEALVKVLSVTSNLETRLGPSLDIKTGAVTIPPISLIVNDIETRLDTSELKGEIMKRKQFLAGRLMGFAADFITGDLAEMMNVYLSRKRVATSWETELYKTFDELGEELSLEDAVEDEAFLKELVIDEADPMKPIMDKLAAIIHKSKVRVNLKKISTPRNKDIELYGELGLSLNGRSMTVRNTLGNSNRTLPPLSLDAHRTEDINLAISEPLINGVLDLASSTGLFQKIFDQIAGVKGFRIANVKAHFTERNTIMMVVNSKIDLKSVNSDGLSDWIKNTIAAILERNNNNAVIFFPLDMEILPMVTKLPSGEVKLQLKVLSPFTAEGLTNKFKYPTNVDRMYDSVRRGVMKKLRKSLATYVDRSYDVDLTKFLNQSGVTFLPTKISVEQSAYLMMNLSLVDIKFNSQNPLAR